MKPRFADTGFYAALANRRDSLHERATEELIASAHGIVTTEFVLVETANFYSQPAARPIFLDLLARSAATPPRPSSPCHQELFERGAVLFETRPDKDWSLTDCISFTIMDEQKLTDALTADQHFVQAGFMALLA